MEKGYRFARGWVHHLTITLTPETRAALDAMQRPGQPVPLARRARVIGLRAQGLTYAEIHRQTGMTVNHSVKWVRRYVQDGLLGLQELPSPNHPPPLHLRPGDHATLRQWQQRGRPPGLARRAQVLLLRAAGHSYGEVRQQTGCINSTITRLVRHYQAHGLAGMEDHLRTTLTRAQQANVRTRRHAGATLDALAQEFGGCARTIWRIAGPVRSRPPGPRPGRPAGEGP
jgi:transposase